jgi:hypothetical protein
LAVSHRGREFLSHTRKQREVPLIQNFSRVYATLKRYYGAESADYNFALQQLDLELRATKIYTLLLHKCPSEKYNRDFYEVLRL